MFAKQIFSAEIIEIQEVFGATATNTSLVMLVYYVVYALSQFALVLFIDKINIRNFLFITLIISSVLTILIGVVGNMGAGLQFLFIVFAVNGILQVANYAGIVKIFSKYLNREKYMFSMKVIYAAGTVSLASSYAVSALFVAFSRWDIPFIISGGLFFISVLVFFFGYNVVVKKIKELGHFEQGRNNEKEEETKITLSRKTKRSTFVFMVLVCIIALLSNFVFYGLNNWFSKLLYDVHGIPKHYSILLSVGVSLLTAVASAVAISYFSKSRRGNQVATLGYVVLMVLSVVISLTYKLNVIYVMLICVLFICLAQGVKTLYTSVIAYDVKCVVEPGIYSLFFNGMASIAAGCSPTLISFIFENFGWSYSFISLGVVSAILVFALILIRTFQTKMMRGYNEDKIKFNELLKNKN